MSGGVIEPLLPVPLLASSQGESAIEGSADAVEEGAGLTARKRERLSELLGVQQDPQAIDALLGEVRNLVHISPSNAAAVEEYLVTARARIARVADALANPTTTDFNSPQLLIDLSWVEGWLDSLEPVRAANASAAGGGNSSLLTGAMTPAAAESIVPSNTATGDTADKAGTLPAAPQLPAELPMLSDQAGSLDIVALNYGGYGGDPPVARDDIAYSAKNQQVRIYVLDNDTGSGKYVAGVGSAAHGTVLYDQYSVIYTPNSDFASGSDSFTYCMRDSSSGISTATVTVNMVQVTDFTLERLKPDNVTWEAVTGLYSWSHDTLRWTASCTPADTLELQGAHWYAQPWGGGTGREFASGSQQTIGNPGAGDWGIWPMLVFNSPHQTSFMAQLQTPKHRIDAEIETVFWAQNRDPNLAAELAPDATTARLYPDSPTPGGALRHYVDVSIQVWPRLAGIPVDVRWRDVDDPTDNDGPIDADPARGSSGQPQNPADNLGGPGVDACFENLPGTTDANGRILATLNIQRTQPGNNYRVAAGGHADEIDRLYAIAADSSSRLFYDRDGNGSYGNTDGAIDYDNSDQGIVATPALVVWRKLHIEADSMGPVEDNYVPNHSGDVRQVSPGKWAVPLIAGAVQENRFQNGKLSDGMHYFDIESNTPNELTVLGTPSPVSDTDICLWDDDSYTMPEMPALGLMEQAFSPAFIDPVLDGGGNPSYNREDVPFSVNVPYDNQALGILSRIFAQNGLQSDGNRSNSFWVAYVQSAYQGDERWDGDPDTELTTGTTVGETPTQLPIGSLVYLESLREVAKHLDPTGANLGLLKERVVVHEIAHQFGVLDDPNGLLSPSIMCYDNMFDAGNRDGSTFNEHQKLILRARIKSPGVL